MKSVLPKIGQWRNEKRKQMVDNSFSKEVRECVAWFWAYTFDFQL